MMKKLRITFNSPVVLIFAAICLVATILGTVTRGGSNALLFSTYRASIASPLTYLRLIGHVFGHSSWEHLIGNMSYILLLGPMLEEKYGSKNLIGVMVTTALVTALIIDIFFPDIALLGASGIVFAFILLASFSGFKDGEIPLTFILVAVIYIGQQVYEGVFLQDQVSQLAHIIGGGIGGVAGFVLNKGRD
jgi:GlpG protein